MATLPFHTDTLRELYSQGLRVSLMVSGDFSDGEQAFRAIGRAFELICRRVKLL
ncbi:MULTISPECIES: hypothetical protein [unclassified Bradyrhizobium]|uniref:hypothetical protein n=1 Tax=unclassified Bradyrhizobium TaxID=2631580 RepID=UPI001FF73A14|nr:MULTISPECIES: hypothetical protein [unclassified Bradyrhizobium]MCK1325212.1 hypothetical protein [Bradyrhizobium sp. 156]MCK1329518.1 hypothetical protein [Bradyrhizobium sp. CW9]MCK1341081.1 hypothetical protein [Bradyrhizobium sp. 38]MCK1411868.1 hypothetical protein [Bradyrhizobium sp. CW4]MCK1433528.1 hypothetical protein [Bradyrhizobium sp. 87]